MTSASVMRSTAAVWPLLLLLGCSSGTSEDTGAGTAAARALQPDSTDRPKIVALGDSLTEGYGLFHDQAYPALLQERLDTEGYDVEVVNAGVAGDTTAGGLRRLDWLLDERVRILIVALGGNDGLRGLPVSEMKRNLSGVIEKAQGKGIAVILTGMEAPPNQGEEYTSQFRNAFRELAETYNVVYMPFLLEDVGGVAELNQADGIHPNAEGSRVIADHLWKILRPLLDDIVTP